MDRQRQPHIEQYETDRKRQKHQNEKAQTANIFTAPKWGNEGQKPQGAQHQTS